MNEGQYSMMIPASSQDQSQEKSNMGRSSWEADHTLIFELLWPYRDYFPGTRFGEIVKEITDEYGRRKPK